MRWLVPLSAIALLIAPLGATAHASIPDPSLCTCPKEIHIVTFGPSGADPVGRFCVRIIGMNGLPVEGTRVIVDLSGCADVRICADVLDPDVVVNCSGREFSKLTDVSGWACFTLPGGSTGGIGTPAAPSGGCAWIFWEWQAGRLLLLGSPAASVFDLDGQQGIGAGDLAVWISDWLSGANVERANYVSSDPLGAGDLSRWIDVWLSSGEYRFSCSSRCP
jgi:hypothetical protein